MYIYYAISSASERIGLWIKRWYVLRSGEKYCNINKLQESPTNPYLYPPPPPPPPLEEITLDVLLQTLAYIILMSVTGLTTNIIFKFQPINFKVPMN